MAFERRISGFQVEVKIWRSYTDTFSVTGASIKLPDAAGANVYYLSKVGYNNCGLPKWKQERLRYDSPVLFGLAPYPLTAISGRSHGFQVSRDSFCCILIIGNAWKRSWAESAIANV